MRYTFLIAIISLFFIGCNKDKFSTSPQIKYKSVNTKVLDKFQVLSFTLSFTDLEGDLDSIFLQKINPHCDGSNFKDSMPLPAFPSTRKQQGEIFVTYGYRADGYPWIQEPACSFNDTCVFKFYVKDKQHNKSDTITSEQIVIIK